jgi:hypothetical protein
MKQIYIGTGHKETHWKLEQHRIGGKEWGKVVEGVDWHIFTGKIPMQNSHWTTVT